jgi:hypothetical protein
MYVFMCVNPLSRARMLASGHRSYAYSKRLVGSRVPLLETKLDRGVRILWSQLRRDREKPAIIVSGDCWGISPYLCTCTCTCTCTYTHSNNQACP